MSDELFGWFPPSARTPAMQRANDEALEGMQPFFLRGPDNVRTGRFPLWKLAREALGDKFKLCWQTTGSCVGASGYNALLVLMGVEIAAGDAEEYPEGGIWWPWTYGQSRRLGGFPGQGEGSFGSAWARAARECGFWSPSETTESEPAFTERQGWIQLPASVEMQWSNGSAWNREPYVGLGRTHLVASAAPIKTTNDAKAALQNGYPIIMASLFGTRNIARVGDPAVNVATWDTTWAHQMSITECWDHPGIGTTLYYVQNNWGPGAHPSPTGDEPAGGFYITERTLGKILDSRDAELFALSLFSGFKVRVLPWTF